MKVQITLRVDLDILEHFKKRAESSHSAPYQTQINSELRKIMEKDLSEENTEINKNIEDLAKNKKFIRAVAEHLKELETV